MPQNSNKRAQIANLSETATFHECAEFFKKFGKVKNTKVSIKNWVISLEKFRKEAGFIRKIDEIAIEAELDQQLSEYGRHKLIKKILTKIWIFPFSTDHLPYIVAMRQQNSQEYSASSIQTAIAAIRVLDDT
ncbi:unnamed protein product [Rhizophagus irregularis]|nr:unnamed protein product [Rhizophagus irregularis]